MARFEFSSSEEVTVVCALRLAAERYDEDVKVCNENGHPRLAEQFVRQAKDARALADKIEMGLAS